MQDNLKGLAKRVLYRAGYYTVSSRLKGPRAPRLVVLMYHDVLDDADGSNPRRADTESPTASQFSAHAEQLARRHRVLSIRDATDEIRRGGLREDTVAITFDDGYASVYASAYPTLKRLGLPATIFVLTGWINREAYMWWQELRAIAARSTFSGSAVRRVESILGVPLLSGGRSLLEVRRHFLGAAEPWLRGLDEAMLASRLKELREAALPGMTSLSVHNQALTWDQLREMSEGGVELGAHTHSHINLRHSDPEAAAREIMKSKAEIARNTRRDPVGFAYPYGKDVEYYRPAVEILRAEGFTYACTAIPGVNDGNTDPFYLRRIVVPSTTSAALINRELSLTFLRDA